MCSYLDVNDGISRTLLAFYTLKRRQLYTLQLWHPCQTMSKAIEIRKTNTPSRAYVTLKVHRLNVSRMNQVLLATKISYPRQKEESQLSVCISRDSFWTICLLRHHMWVDRIHESGEDMAIFVEGFLRIHTLIRTLYFNNRLL